MPKAKSAVMRRARYPPREKVRISASSMMKDATEKVMRVFGCVVQKASMSESGIVMPQKNEAICGSGKKALARRKFVPPTLTTMLEYSETTSEKVCPENSGRIVLCQKSMAGSRPIINGRKNCAMPTIPEITEPYTSTRANISRDFASRNTEKATKKIGKNERRKLSLRSPHERFSTKKRENAKRKKTESKRNASNLEGSGNDRRMSE